MIGGDDTQAPSWPGDQSEVFKRFLTIFQTCESENTQLWGRFQQYDLARCDLFKLDRSDCKHFNIYTTGFYLSSQRRSEDRWTFTQTHWQMIGNWSLTDTRLSWKWSLSYSPAFLSSFKLTGTSQYAHVCIRKQNRAAPVRSCAPQRPLHQLPQRWVHSGPGDTQLFVALFCVCVSVFHFCQLC